MRDFGTIFIKTIQEFRQGVNRRENRSAFSGNRAEILCQVGERRGLYCCSITTWPDYWYDFLEGSRVLPINKEIFGAFVAQLRKEKGLVRENVAEQGSLLDESWRPE